MSKVTDLTKRRTAQRALIEYPSLEEMARGLALAAIDLEEVSAEALERLALAQYKEIVQRCLEVIDQRRRLLSYSKQIVLDDVRAAVERHFKARP